MLGNNIRMIDFHAKDAFGIKNKKSSKSRNKNSAFLIKGDNKEASTEKFVASGKEKTGEDLSIFNEQDKLKGLQKNFEKGWKGAGEVKSGQIGQDTQVKSGEKPENLSKLEKSMSKYGKHIGANYTAAMAAGLAGAGALALGSIGAGMVGTILGPAGALLGAAVGAAGLPTHSDKTEMTKSGIERHEVYDRSSFGGTTDKVTDYSLPDGTKIHEEFHSARIDASPFYKRDESLSAFSSDGQKLKADFVKDEIGHERIRVQNNNGTITTLDPFNLDLSIQAKTDEKTVSTPKVFSESHPLIPDFNPGLYKTQTSGDAEFHKETIPQKQVIHADGSMDITLNEESSYYTQNIPDPLHDGKTIEKTSPKHHSYTKVSISAEGDTSAERIDENYRMTVSGSTGEIKGHRRKTGDKFAGLFRGKFATSLNTQGDFFVGKKNHPERGEKVAPFITRGDILNARTDFETKNFAENKKDFKDLMTSIGPDGTKFMADGETGKLRALNQDGTKKWSFDVDIKDGVAAPPLANKDSVFVLDKGNKLHCINNGFSGFEKWGAEIKGDIIGSPSFDKDGDLKVFVELDGKKVERTINPKTGNVKGSRIVHTKENAL